MEEIRIANIIKQRLEHVQPPRIFNNANVSCHAHNSQTSFIDGPQIELDDLKNSINN